MSPVWTRPMSTERENHKTTKHVSRIIIIIIIIIVCLFVYIVLFSMQSADSYVPGQSCCGNKVDKEPSKPVVFLGRLCR